jgi:uncharacterized repeat protein (TIGR03803 family)
MRNEMVRPRNGEDAMATFFSGGVRLTPVLALCAVTGASPACAASERVIYSFTGGADGAFPSSGLIDLGGTLYGTTTGNGTAGNVYAVKRSGAQSTVYAFTGGSNGAAPGGGLTNVKGTLYGTTSSGGLNGYQCGDNYCGTVYSVTRAGTQQIVYSFQGFTDGYGPVGGLIYDSGMLYGTTYAGGSDYAGTVFSVTPAGSEAVLYTFTGTADGGSPSSPLVKVGDTFYGTAYLGGLGYGAVYSVTPTGQESVLYAFRGGADGYNPNSLMRIGDVLYGTTGSGGTGNVGTVFKLTLKGKHKVIYSFKGMPDGSGPNGPLIDIDGTLYGTTYGGGTYAYSGGTAFSVRPDGTETVLHSFTGGLGDGLQPAAGLISVGNKLYGTTTSGGGSGCGGNGCGTVFWIKP